MIKGVFTHLIRVFAYGTLKLGQHNHEFCGPIGAIEEGILPGRLYDSGCGFPILQVAPETIVRTASDSLLLDIREAERCANPCPRNQQAPAGDWDWVQGEVITLQNPIGSLQAMDRLESATPHGKGPYQRVLVYVQTASGSAQLAWTYVATGTSFLYKRIKTGIWPANQ